MGGEGQRGQWCLFMAPHYPTFLGCHMSIGNSSRFKTASSRHRLRSSSKGSPVPTAGREEREVDWGASASYSGHSLSIPLWGAGTSAKQDFNSSEHQFHP